jgi:endo-1,4-beta-mannosidase
MDFRLGINYWPADKAMYWWSRFDAAQVRADFERLRKAGFDSVRIFLLWEDFQPEPARVSARALDDLQQVAGLAAKNELSLIVTLFTGHMSGVNWLPQWATRPGPPGRFRVVSKGRVAACEPRNWYLDSEVQQAQALLAREVAQVLRSEPALWAYDLGNENSNCAVPPDRNSAVQWLGRMAEAIRSSDANHAITLGLHAEDLEEDRRLGPGEAARVCDFLCMHGYPLYLSWARSIHDDAVLPFLGLITQWLGGRDVLLEEFGAPAVDSPSIQAGDSSIPLLEETCAAEFTGRALSSLLEAGFAGAMLWCFSDYHPSLWKEPPLDLAPHERHFGLWRWDLSRKSALAAIQRFAGRQRRPATADFTWIDIDPKEYYLAPAKRLRYLYDRYCKKRQEEGLSCQA